MPAGVGVAVIVTAGSLAHLVGEFTVTVGFALTVRVPDADAEEQLVVGLVMITLYAPATVAEKLATLPGAVAPAGTVHA